MNIRPPQPQRSGFVLIIVVIMVALLAIMAVAYLSSSSLERATARASANRTKAELAARSAADVAIARLRDNITQFPDSATVWETINGVPGTVLYFREQPPESYAGSSSTPPPLKVLPLISGATVENATDKTQAFPLVLDDANSSNLNHQRFSGDAHGWVGAPPTSTSPPEFRGQWINETDSDNRVTSRYAYWVEDESFKTNANLMGNTARGSGTLGDSPTQIPLQGLIKAVLPNANADSVANEIFMLRDAFSTHRFFGFRELNHAASQSALADAAKYNSTIYSGALNLSRSGSKRANLNNIVVTSPVAANIRKQLDEIIKAINYHLPNFGQRFYRNGNDLNSPDVPDSGTAAHRTIYLNKIAANIRDYIDTDSQPTIVNNDSGYTVRIGTPPAHPVGPAGGGTAGPNEVIAIGKERVPLIQEYALRVRETAFAPKTGVFANYTISIDHYVEVWNLSNHDITSADLGPNPFLLIANQPGWDAGSFPQIPEGQPRDIKISLPPNWILPAGSFRVFTTDPTLLSALTPDASRVDIVSIPSNLRTYTGQTDKKNSNNWLRLNMIDRTTSISDYETEILFGNDLGILESAFGAGAISSAISVNIDGPENRLDDTKYHFRGASLRATSNPPSPVATTGDPRSNAEQVRMDLNGTAATNDKTRYYSSGLQDNNVPGNSTSHSSLGAANQYTQPATWVDPSSASPSAVAAPAVIFNAPLYSVGQLGDIYDPARAMGDSNSVELSRGGGRTLKIGQSDRFDAANNTGGLWDGNTTSASREWAAWRLTDIFTTTDAVQLDGRININGVGRDDGAALKAALYGYAFQNIPDSDPQLTGSLEDNVIRELVKQLKARITNNTTPPDGYPAFAATSGPFFERGEFSEMPIFNPGSALSSRAPASVIDRGREELFRRLAELITTRGNIFTVYAVGQALAPQANAAAPPRVVSTSKLKVTFRLDPVWTPAIPPDPYDPSTTASVAARFKTPDHYAIKILYAGE